MASPRNGSKCTILGDHCESCGSTDREDLVTGDQGYTACCNELVSAGPTDCRNHHGDTNPKETANMTAPRTPQDRKPKSTTKTLPSGKTVTRNAPKKGTKKETAMPTPTPTPTPKKDPKTCADPDCTQPIVRRGLCRKHYREQLGAREGARRAADAAKVPTPTPATPATNIVPDAALTAMMREIADAAVKDRITEQRARDIAVSAAENVAPRRLTVQVNDAPPKVALERYHRVLPDVLAAVAAGCHVFLVGPAGSGKSTIGEQVAETMGLEMQSISFSDRTPSSKMLGFINSAGDYISTPMRKVYEHGGIFLGDELDNGHPGVIAELNQSLANGYCAFADKVVPKHADYRFIGTGNTFGLGPDRMYVGRNELDKATLDRFVTIEVGYDEKLEREVAMSFADEATRTTITEWIGTVQKIRAAVMRNRLPIVVSPRASIDGAKLLRGGMSVDRVAEIRLWAGIDTDTRAKLQVQSV